MLNGVRIQSFLSMIVILACVIFASLSFASASVYASDGVSAECINNDAYQTVSLKPGFTGLEAKEEIAHKLNEGVSPEDIILIYNSWADVKEVFPNEAKLKDYKVNDLFYVVSPLPMGATYRSGNVIDFGEDGATVHALYNDGGTVGYFYGETALSCQGFQTICNKQYVKYVVGGTAIYLEPDGKAVPTGLCVRHISYNPYDNGFIYGFDSVSGM